MTRVLHVPTLGWLSTDGIARACRELATELDDCTSFLLANRDPGAAATAFAGVRTIRGWAPSAVWRVSLMQILRDLQPDIIHLHGGAMAPALAWSPALARTPVVATCYSPAKPGPGVSWRVPSLIEHRANIPPLRAAIAQTGGMKLARRALQSGRVRVICTPDARVEHDYAAAGPVVRVSGAARVRAARARWSDTPTVVFAGRAQAGRGVDDLISAFPDVRRSIPGAVLRLLLLPGGSAERWSSELATCEWAEVRVGAINDLTTALAECQAGAFPFRWSATLTPALAAAEAMAVGLPVVATSVDCLAPLVDSGVNGALVPTNDPGAVAAALVQILRSPEGWTALSEGARKTIDARWSWAAAADATRDAYALALGAAK